MTTNDINKNTAHETVECNKNISPIKIINDDVHFDMSNPLFLALSFLLLIKILGNTFELIKNIINLEEGIKSTYKFITRQDVVLIDKIDDLMNQLLAITGADRVIIAKIHNGTYDAAGNHEMKFSAVYEVVSVRAKSIKNEAQNIPIDYIKEEILIGDDNNFERFVRRDDIDSECNKYLDKIGIIGKDYKLLSMKGPAKHIIYGIIDLHYINLPINDLQKDAELRKNVMAITMRLEDCLIEQYIKKKDMSFYNIWRIFAKQFRN